MLLLKTARSLAIGMLFMIGSVAANADVKLPDGNDWARATNNEHLAYILGLSNTLTIGYLSDEKHLPGNKNTFTHRAVDGLGGTTVEGAVNVIDAWYKTHPNQLNTPIVKVLWDQIGKPRLAKSK